MSINVNDVCTDADLIEEIGSPEALSNLLARSLGNDSTPARRASMNDVLRMLSRRSPPIRDVDIVDPTELRAAVAYGALTRLYRQSITTADSVFALHSKTYANQFEDEVAGLRPRVADLDGESVSASAFSFGTERR